MWIVAGVAAAGGVASPLQAQAFLPETRSANGFELRVEREPTRVQGVTAREILDALQDDGWPRIRRFYRWRYGTERVRESLTGARSGTCQVSDFTLEVQARVRYPEWEPRGDADPRLRDAWSAFVESLEGWWEARVSRDRDFARRMGRQLRRYRGECGSMNALVRRRWDDAFEEELESRREDPSLQVRWPPAGFEELMAEGTATSPAGLDETGTEAGAAAAEPGRAGDGPEPEEGGPPGSENPEVGIVEALVRGGAVAPGLDPPPPFPTSFAAALAEDFDGSGVSDPPLVLGILRDGGLLGVQPAGTEATTGEAPAADAVVPFPGLTELLVAALVTALDREGVLDVEAPIGSWLPELDGTLGSATLEQLLAHRAGLDNAAWPPEADRGNVVAGLDDGSLFTRPGSVFSFSRYSYPLAARVVETVTGAPLAESLRSAILDPLALSRTFLDGGSVPPDALAPSVLDPDPPDPDPSGPEPPETWDPEGLPVTFTTVADAARLALALVQPGTVGVDADELLALARREGTDWGWSGGLWWSGQGGALQARLVCAPGAWGVSSGLVVFPGTGTGVVAWAAKRWPHQAVRFLVDSAVQGQPVERDPYAPTAPRLPARISAETWGRCPYPNAAGSFGTLTATGGPVRDPDLWVGRYANGDRLVGLVPGEEGLIWEGSGGRLVVRHIQGDLYGAFETARSVAFPLRLLQDATGRRYLVLDGRAYLHLEDRSTGD